MDRDIQPNLRQPGRSVVKNAKESKTSTNSVFKSDDVPLSWKDLTFRDDFRFELQTPKEPKRTNASSAAFTRTDKQFVERCLHWPQCTHRECTYRHPTEPCKQFPNCPYGSRCFRIHPDCSLDANCKKIDCPFTHRSKRDLSTAASALADHEVAGRGATVRVTNLAQNIVDNDLKSLFGKYGRVEKVLHMKDKFKVGKSFGYITYERPEDAAIVVKIGKISFRNAILNVTWAKPRK